MEGKFLCKSTTGNYYAALGTYGDKVIITATEEDNGYTIKWADNNELFLAYDSYIYSSSYGQGWYDFFVFSETSKGYSIQRSPKNTDYYKSDEFVGFDGSNGDRLSPALAEGSIHWIFLSEEDGDYYIAKLKLFTYLEVADQYNFYVTQYEQVYEKQNATTAELDFTQATLKNALDMSQNYVSPSWTEYPILFQNTTDNYWELYNHDRLQWDKYGTTGGEVQTSTLTATVNVDNDAVLVFSFSASSGCTSLRFYLDGTLVQSVAINQCDRERRYFVPLTPGKHDIAWTCVDNNERTDWHYIGSAYLSEIGVVNTPTITPATTTTEGQLGTNVLKYQDPISGVKRIVITGIIGEEDWNTIGLMVNAFSIDMSGATATAPMPADIFKGDKFPFLYDVKLPNGLTAIGGGAFYYSNIENDIVFPSSLETIGESAFNGSKIKGAHIQEGVTSIGSYAFRDCHYLENANYPSTVTYVPYRCFQDCYNLRTFTIPEGITEIGDCAFQSCNQFNPRFPSTLEKIGYRAFQYTATDSLFVTEGMTIDDWAFEYNNNLVYTEWPSSFYHFSNSAPIFGYCPNLNKVKFMSPTKVTYRYQNFCDVSSDITLLVPDFLEAAYKLDEYWYHCNVVGYDSSDQKDWVLAQPLALIGDQRIGGTPNIEMQQQSTLTIDGDTPQTLGDLEICRDWYCGDGWNTMILSNTNHVTINGKLTYRASTPEKKWEFFCLPFDTKVSDITSDASFAIRYYDGASRATNGTGGNWKNYEANDIIPAGTGFILQTSKQCSTYFVALDNASKQNVVGKNEFVKTLEANPSEVNANRGWNLIGNPWLTYFNIHKLDFTAPITVWNGDPYYGGKYEAYSIIDDDYAIKPLEAIFVQCPDADLNTIEFPIDGRQLTTEIESQSGVRAQAGVMKERQLIDVVLSDGDEKSDKTRVVINERAQQGYELSCDASKFDAMSRDVIQLYTLDADGTRYAINERPTGEGVVSLGFYVPMSGTYTIAAPRNDFQTITLMDAETGLSTNLSTGSYTFTADAGTNAGRFQLMLGEGGVTGINAVAAMPQRAVGGEVFNLQGQRVSNARKGLYIVDGKKVVK